MKTPRRPANESFVDLHLAIEDIQKHINSSAPARQALAKLLRAGCNKESILVGLYMYCGEKAEKRDKIKEALGNRKKRIVALSQQLQEVADEIEAVEPYLLDIGIVCHFTPDTSSLRAYGELLQRLGKTVFRELASKRISGRDHHAVYLYSKVKLSTGRPHYTELADLINVVRQGYDSSATEVTDAESLRKRISRYGLLDPQIEVELDQLIEFLDAPRKGRR